ncbi:ABC transporter permease [Streptomyces sp. NPDC006372]|uniref:ABC transporter permease n=1 Tax=Streptomyces sp. NPDC006372 TaxID=3155599 RepID=UPI0033A96599
MTGIAIRTLDALWVLWTCARMQVKAMKGNELGLVIGVVQPVVLILVTVGAHTDEAPEVLTGWTVGVLLTTLWASTVWIAGGILRGELRSGTLARSVTSLRPGFLVLLGKCLGATARALLVISCSVAVTLLMSRAPVTADRPGWMLLGLLASVCSGAALGMLLACILLLTRYGLQVSAALMYPVFILGGLLVPPDLLPGFLHWLPSLISLRWAREFLTNAAAGTVSWQALIWLVALTTVYFLLAVKAFARVIDHARREGTLELV